MELRREDEATCVGYSFHPGTDAFASCLQKEGLAPRYYAVWGLGFLVGRGLGAVLAVTPPSTCRRGWDTVSGPTCSRSHQRQLALRERTSPALSQAIKALMPLHRISDPTTAFAFSLPPPFSAPLFPSPTVKPFTLAPFLSPGRWRSSRTNFNRKPWCRLHLHLGMGRL